MRSYNTLYYLLTVLLIMGAFASMAQNSYGMLIIGGVTIAFALIFGIRFFQPGKNSGGHEGITRIEYLALFVLSVIFLLRILQIYFPSVEWIFAMSGLTLSWIYMIKAMRAYREFKMKNRRLAILLMTAYLIITVFCLAMVSYTTSPLLAKILGILSLVLLAVFLSGGLANDHLMVDGEQFSVFGILAGFRDRYFLLLSFFILFSLYLTLTISGILPGLYSDKYPQAYYELVNMAESGKEKPVDNRYKYEDFKKAYDQFVEKNVVSRKK
jgi:hypothetical protein